MNRQITKKDLEHAKNVQRIFKELGLDFSIKSFLGPQSKADEIAMSNTNCPKST